MTRARRRGHSGQCGRNQSIRRAVFILWVGHIHSGTDHDCSRLGAEESLSLPTPSLCLFVSLSISLLSPLSLSISLTPSLSLARSLPPPPPSPPKCDSLNYLLCSLVEHDMKPSFWPLASLGPRRSSLFHVTPARARAVASVDRRLSKLPPGRAVPRAAATFPDG